MKKKLICMAAAICLLSGLLIPGTPGPRVAAADEKPERLWLEDLEPVSVQALEGLHRGESAPGRLIQLGDREYEHGISAHPMLDGTPAEIVYDITGLGYNTFSATVGKDLISGDAVGGADGIMNTSISVEIWADGQLRADSSVLTYPRTESFAIDVTGVKELKILMTPGTDGVYCDTTSLGDACFTNRPVDSRTFCYLDTLEYSSSGDAQITGNKTYLEQPITVGGVLYSHGISVTLLNENEKTAEVVYKIDGLGYNEFSAVFGKDLTSGAQVGGAVGIWTNYIRGQVFVDGVLKEDSGNLPYPETYPFHVDITGAKELRLVVTDGEDGVYCDTGSFADARLILNPKEDPGTQNPGTQTPGTQEPGTQEPVPETGDRQPLLTAVCSSVLAGLVLTAATRSRRRKEAGKA